MSTISELFDAAFVPQWTGYAPSNVALAAFNQTNTPIAGVSFGTPYEIEAGHYFCDVALPDDTQRGFVTFTLTGSSPLQVLSIPFSPVPQRISGSVGSVTGSVGSVTGNVGGSVASVVAPVSATAPVLASGTATAGTTSTVTLAVGSSAVDGAYAGKQINFTGGTGSPDSRTIIGYVGSTRVAALDRAMPVALDNTTVYSILYSNQPAVSPSGQVTVSNILPGSYVLKVLMAGGVPSISSVPAPTKIIVARGASLAISVPIFQADGVTPQDLTGWSAVFMVKADANDPDSTVPTVGKALIYKDTHAVGGMTIPTPANGILLFSLLPGDTYEEEPFTLFPLGTWEFVWGLKLFDPSGTLQPPGAGGAFVVQGFPVHRQTPPP